MKWISSDGAVFAHIRNSAHIYRQILATVTTSLLFLSGGVNMGQTAVLFPQLENDTTFPYDKSLNSWIASLAPLAMIVGTLTAGTMSDWIGRKTSQMILSATFMFGWIIMGSSYSNELVLISRFITGFSFGAIISSGVVFIAELADPRYRATALIFTSVSTQIGNLMSHTIGKYVYWRYSCFIYVIPNLMSLLILVFLNESPLWLFSKGKINEGMQSFKLYRGNTESSEKELILVLQKSSERTVKPSFQEMLKVILSKSFMKTLVSAFLLFVATQWSGINALSYYAEDIFQKTFSGDLDAFSFMIISDCNRVIINSGICIFTNCFPQRITFIVSCFISCLMLTTMAVYVHLRPIGLVGLATTCLIIYIGTGTALSSISYSIVSEIFPVNVRGFGVGLGSAISFALLFVCVKVTPEIIINYGEVALYAFYAVVTFISGICLIFMLPETYNLSLQGIEDSLYIKKQNNHMLNTLSNSEQTYT